MGSKPAFGLLPLSAHKQNKEIPSMAVLVLFIKTIDGIAYFAIAIFIFSHLSDIIYLAKVMQKTRINLCEVQICFLNLIFYQAM